MACSVLAEVIEVIDNHGGRVDQYDARGGAGWPLATSGSAHAAEVRARTLNFGCEKSIYRR
jgi:hypothetical protein